MSEFCNVRIYTMSNPLLCWHYAYALCFPVPIMQYAENYVGIIDVGLAENPPICVL